MKPKGALRAAFGLLALFLAFSSQGAALAQAPGGSPTSLDTKAKHAVILDHDTNLVLFAKDADRPFAPASMSKLMTSLVVFDKIASGEIALDQEFTVSENAWRKGGAATGGSTMFLPINARVRVEDLLRGVIVVSGNDACIVLAEGIAGTEGAFVQLMNEKAKALGLKQSRFTNVTGLDEPGHEMSALDLARLARHIIDAHPEFYRIYSERSFTYGKHTQGNRNPLLGRIDGADGMKTGHTDLSGYGLVGSARQGEVRRIIVFNGLKSNAERTEEADKLMRAAFGDFRAVRLFEKGALVGEADVFLGSRKKVTLTARDPIVVAIHRAARDGMKAAIVYDKPLPAPIRQGDVVAQLEVSAPGLPPTNFPLIAGRKVGKAGLFGLAGAGLQKIMGGDDSKAADAEKPPIK